MTLTVPEPGSGFGRIAVNGGNARAPKTNQSTAGAGASHAAISSSRSHIKASLLITKAGKSFDSGGFAGQTSRASTGATRGVGASGRGPGGIIV